MFNLLLIGCLSFSLLLSFFVSCKQRTYIRRLSSTIGRSLTHADIVFLALFFFFFTIDDKRTNLYVCCCNLFTSCVVVMVGIREKKERKMNGRTTTTKTIDSNMHTKSQLVACLPPPFVDLTVIITWSFGFNFSSLLSLRQRC